MKAVLEILFLFLCTAWGNNCIGCWLRNLVIELPDEGETQDGVFMGISNFSCTGLNLGEIDSFYSGPNLYVDANDVTLYCSGNWSYNITFFPEHDEGAVYVLVGHSGADLGVELISENNIPIQASLNCSNNIIIQSLEFAGGDIAGKILEIFSDLISLIVETKLHSQVCPYLETIVNENITQILQFYGDLIEPFNHPVSPFIPPVIPDNEYISFQNSSTIILLDLIVNQIGGANGVLGLNFLIDKLTNGTGTISGYFADYGILPYNQYIQDVANVTLTPLKFTIEGLNSWSTVDMLIPLHDYSLSSSLKMDNLSISIIFNINITVEGLLNDNTLSETLVISLSDMQPSLNLTFLLLLKEENLQKYKTQPELLTVPGCIVDSITSLQVDYLYFTFNQTPILNITFLDDFEEEYSYLLFNIVKYVINAYDVVTPNIFDNLLSGPIVYTLNEAINETMASYTDCSLEYPSEPINVLTYSFGAAGGAFCLLMILIFVFKRVNTRTDYEALEFTTNPPGLHNATCLVDTKRFHWVLQLSVPLLIFCTASMFASAVLAPGVVIFAVVYFSQSSEYIVGPNLIEMAQFQSISDMWSSEVYFLATFATFTGLAWPYIKLILMVWCWIAPPHIFSLKRREQLLLVLDALGKWSLLDSYLLIMMMVGFHTSLYDPQLSDAVLKVLVKPDWGFFLFIVATMLSLALSHVILASHRLSTSTPNHNVENQSLSTRTFIRYSSAKQWLGSYTIGLSLLGCITLLFYSIFQSCMIFSISGAVGEILLYLNETNEMTYSLYSFGTEFPKISITPDDGGIRFIQFFYMFFSIFLPIIHCILLFLLWIIPISLYTQRKYFFFIEIMHAWSTYDVLTLSLILAYFGVPQFVQYLLNGTHRCDFINQILVQYFYKELKGDVKCVDMAVYFTDEVWFIFSACLFYMIVVNVVMRVMRFAIERAPVEIVVPQVQ